MEISNQEYSRLVQARVKPSPLWRDVAWAFGVGGAICALGQALLNWYQNLGLDQEQAGTAVSVTLVFAAAVLTGLGWFDKLAKRAGAGTLVPITGFANAMVSPALEFRHGGQALCGGRAGAGVRHQRQHPLWSPAVFPRRIRGNLSFLPELSLLKRQLFSEMEDRRPKVNRGILKFPLEKGKEWMENHEKSVKKVE